MSGINAYTGHPITFQTADEDYVYVAINSFNGFDTWKSDFLKYFPSFQIENHQPPQPTPHIIATNTISPKLSAICLDTALRGM